MKTLLQTTIRWSLAVLCLAVTIDGGSAGSFTRGCAMRDMHVLMLIEERESKSAIAMEKLSEVMFTLEQARMTCHEGRVADALSLYDSISESVSSDAAPTGRKR